MSAKGKSLGLFSKLSRKSVSDLSEWNKNDERLMQCVEHSDLKEIISLLKKKKVSSTKLDPQGHSALHVAAMRNKYDVVQLLIAYNANVTAVDFQGRTALHCAARHGASEVLEVLSHSKDDDWPRDESKMTALHHACIGGDLDCVINLIRKYPRDLQSGDEDGRTPLFYASQIGHLLVCKELLDRGAKVDVQDKFGRTALMCAAENGNKHICELFVKKGAKVDVCDSVGHTAAWYAMDAGHTAVKQTIDPSPPLSAKVDKGERERDYPSRQRVHSPILEETESVLGEDETLPLRFRSRHNGGRKNSKEDILLGVDIVGDDSDDELKTSTLSDSDEDGSISPRLSELSYTMSHVKSDSNVTHNTSSLPLDGHTDKQISAPACLDVEDEEFLVDISDFESISGDSGRPVLVTDLDAVDDPVAVSSQPPPSKPDTIVNASASKQEPQIDKSDILNMSDGISLSSDDETDVPINTQPPIVKNDKELQRAHDSLRSNYESLKVEYNDMIKKISELEERRRRHSAEEQQATEQMDMVLQLSELSSQLDDEQIKNRKLQAQIKTLENLAGGVVDGLSDAKQTGFKGGDLDADNWLEYEEDEEDSDDEFGFPGLCLLNNASGKQGKEDGKPVAKVSGKQRQISLKEENREIAKLKTEIESVERQKHSLTEAVTQIQSKYEESEHMRKKLISDLDISKSTIEVKNQEAATLTAENAELQQQVTKYKERSIATVEHAKTYKKEIEKLNRKLELYDREYRKVKDRLKKKDANEKRMLKDRQNLMRKVDEATRKLRDCEKSYEELRQSSHAEADSLMVKCEQLESELVLLREFNEDQNDEIERLVDVTDCSEEILHLKQLEVESLEKQIILLRDVALTPPTKNTKDTESTIKSLQDQITKLQAQLAETAQSYQEAIDIYRNNLILASKDMLSADVKEALLQIIELRKLS